MFYVIERAGEVRRQELIDNAHRGSHRRFVVRQPVGRFLIRIGDRLVGDAQPEPQVNRSPQLAV